MRDLLNEIIDFERVRRQQAVKLFLSATAVRTGKIAIFKNEEITADHVLASACMPFRMRAQEIHGEYYWDGGFMGNPAIFPVIYGCNACDILLALLWQIFSGRDSQISFSVTHGRSAFGGPTMRSTLSDWEVELARWLKPFLERLGHKARRRMCPLYVTGLIGPGDRKSVQPMAERLAPGNYDQLHHFVTAGVWDSAPLETELLIQADKLVGGGDAVMVIDDTAVPKKGKHSVGVASQYASALGKNANCQTLVSLTLARDEVPVVVALRLFLPESWTSDPTRLKRAGVPVEYRTERTKPEMALAEIDRVIAAGVRFGCVVADAGYGLSAPFRQGLTARKLVWAVGIPRHLKVYPLGVQMIWPVAKRGRPRQRHVPNILSIPAEDMLADAKWQTVSWRAGTKGKLKARFAAVRVRVADGPPQRIRDKGQQHLPGDEVWLVGEHRLSGERKYYLANLPAATDLRTLAATIKARWICEQAHQQMKEELGLDHFEGRSWQGLHRHALMTMLAFAFLQHRRLKSARRGKKNQWTAASTQFAVRPSRHRRAHRSTAAETMPALPKMDLATKSGVSKSAKVVLGSRLIKSTIRGRQRGRRRPGNLAPACRSGLRCV